MAIDPQSFAKLPKSKLTQKPVLHFAHANGMPSAVYLEAGFFAFFEPFFTIERVSMLGATPDYPVDNHWKSLTQQVTDSIESACQKHGVDTLVVVGHSLGAMCSLQSLYRAPDRVSQAVLLDPPWIYGRNSLLWHLAKTADRLPMMNHRLMDKLSPSGISKYRRDVWDSRKDAYQKLRHKAFFKDFTEDSFNGYIKYGLEERADTKVTLAIPKSSEVAVFRSNPSWYWLTPNKAPKPPVTLIIGEDSIFLKQQFPQKIKSRLGINFETHPGGHMFPLEHPKSVANRVLELLAKQCQSAAVDKKSKSANASEAAQ